MGGVQCVDLTHEDTFRFFEQGLLDFTDGLVFVLVHRGQDAAAQPGKSQDLNGTATGLDTQRLRFACDEHILYGQGLEDGDGIGPPPRVGNIVIAHQEHDGDAGPRDSRDATGELALQGR